jgi:carboxyl-terminal processing protease
MQQQNTRKFWLPFLLAIALATGFYLGCILSPLCDSSSTKGIFRSHRGSNPLDEVLNLINENYVEAPAIDSFYDIAIESLLSQLDPHSYLIRKKDMQAVTEEMTGNFEGVGIEFYIVRDTIQVVTPIPGGPAEMLGILSGDKIIKVNDTIVAGIGIRNEDVMKMLKGPKGTKVKVSIQRQGRVNPLEFTITRGKIPLYSVDGSFMMDKETGFIKINRFSETTIDEFSERLAELKSKGLKNLILDLRQNPGGYLQQAVNLLSEIMGEKRLVVYTEGRSFPRQEYYSDKLGSFTGKIVILIDEGSASASEIVAGAIQDWDRGVVIGRRSFGKGLVQDQYLLSNGSALRLTIAKYYTPSGRCIQKPYTNGRENYNADLEERYAHGELFNGKDSVKTVIDTTKKYYTKLLKRVVYAGGGIVPDIYIPFDTTYLNEFTMNVITQGLIQEFIYSYFSKEGAQLKQQYREARQFVDEYKTSETFYNQFIAYCRDKGVVNANLAFSEATKAYLSNRLKGFLAKQLFGNDGMLMVSARNDDAVKKAMEVLKKKELLEGL